MGIGCTTPSRHWRIVFASRTPPLDGTHSSVWSSTANTARVRAARRADQTEEWFHPMVVVCGWNTMRANAAKVGGDDVGVAECPHSGVENSVAEQSANFWADIRQGCARTTVCCNDHREAPRETI